MFAFVARIEAYIWYHSVRNRNRQVLQEMFHGKALILAWLHGSMRRSLPDRTTDRVLQALEPRVLVTDTCTALLSQIELRGSNTCGDYTGSITCFEAYCAPRYANNAMASHGRGRDPGILQTKHFGETRSTGSTPVSNALVDSACACMASVGMQFSNHHLCRQER